MKMMATMVLLGSAHAFAPDPTKKRVMIWTTDDAANTKCAQP